MQPAQRQRAAESASEAAVPSSVKPVAAVTELPLAGTMVLDFSQFLSGPVAALRLADLGARVIKIERPITGDIGRTLSFAGLQYDGDTMSFHAMNRHKESYAADLKSRDDLARVRELISHADVLIQNFRPGVMERLGLGEQEVRHANPRLVYASITGYGSTGPWRDRPGQDLLAQSLSGLTWLSGDADQGPVPVGTSLADLLASCHLALGITALLLRRERTGRGGLIETSLMEGLLDLQFELLSAHFSTDGVVPRRGGPPSASPFIHAPYGVYRTTDGFLAIAMNPVPRIGELVALPELAAFTDPVSWWEDRDHIIDLLAAHLRTQSTQYWLDILERADVWCSPVLTLAELAETQGFASLDMVQPMVRRGAGPAGGELTLSTTRSPLRIDGALLTDPTGAPRVGEHTSSIDAEFRLPATGASS